MASYARPAVLVALLALAIQPAGAQSFLDSLFGSDEAAPSRPASGYVRTRPASSSFDGLFGSSEYDTPLPHVRDTTYRTLCVRMCDGFYFPISHCNQQHQLLPRRRKMLGIVRRRRASLLSSKLKWGHRGHARYDGPCLWVLPNRVQVSQDARAGMPMPAAAVDRGGTCTPSCLRVGTDAGGPIFNAYRRRTDRSVSGATDHLSQRI